MQRLRQAQAKAACSALATVGFVALAVVGGLRLEAAAQDEERREAYSDVTCALDNISTAVGDDDGCVRVHVQHEFYPEERTRLQWRYPHEERSTVCGVTNISALLPPTFGCYADKAFIRVYRHAGTPLDRVGPLLMLLGGMIGAALMLVATACYADEVNRAEEAALGVSPYRPPAPPATPLAPSPEPPATPLAPSLPDDGIVI